jgi:probable HAF family extracellular repeat protein
MKECITFIGMPLGRVVTIECDQYTTLDDPNGVIAFGQGTGANNINNLGEIVGSYADANGIYHGFIYQNGVYTTLDDPLGVGGTGLYGVNDLGQIVGVYFDASGTAYAFLATPTVPEPGSLTLVAITGVALTVRRLRRRA